MTVYTGHAAYTTDPQLAPTPGYYALDADGKQFRQPLQRLISVDEAPDEPGNGACHYEPVGNQLATEPEATVGFDAHAHGLGETP